MSESDQDQKGVKSSDGFESPERKISKVLIIPERFGSSHYKTSPMDYLHGDLDVQLRYEDAVLRIFNQAGYRVSRGGSYSGKAGELGFGIERSIATPAEYFRMMAEISQTRLPREFSLDDQARPLFLPTVAKIKAAHGGDSVYLIESRESWIRFEAWRRMSYLVGELYYQADSKAIIQEALDRVRNNKLDYKWFDKKIPLNYWSFQEFIDCPSQYYTSFRIIADAFGEVHGGALIRSPKIKGSERRDCPQMQWSQDPINEVSHINGEFAVLLEHPKSPFFLNSKKIVSNVAQGGIKILLNGKPVDDKTNSSVLIEHGINPDNPLIPKNLTTRASEIGKASRGICPYVGVDFIFDVQLNTYLLEVNTGPTVSPDIINLVVPESVKKRYEGLPARMSYEYCQPELLKRIAKK